MTANTTSDTEGSDEGVGQSTLAWGTCSFESGSDVGLVARHTVGLIERDNPSTRERLWRLVSDDAPLDDILDELSSTGLKALPDFGIAQAEGADVRVVARGRTTIIAERSSGEPYVIDASGVRTWIEEVVNDVVSLTIALPATDAADEPSESDGEAPAGEQFAVLAGSVPARSLTRRFDVADAHAAAADAGWSTGDTGPDDAEAGSESDSDADVATAIDSAVDLEIAAADESDAGADSWFTSGDESSVSPVPPQPSDPQPSGPPPVGPGVGGPAPDASATSGSHEDSAPDAEGGPAPESGSGSMSSIFDDDVIDDRPRGGPDDADGSAGFATPDDSATSDDFATSAPGAPAVAGVLAFSNGERIGVDRNVLIGRNPKVAGAVDGPLPHIMKFDGPGQGLSRTHAEVRVENDEMVIEDLQSTNGTEVQLPGQQRRRLRAGEPIVVVPGTLIDFGDELRCTVETAG